MRLLPKRFHPATLDDLAAAKQRILRPARAAYHFLVRLNSWLARNNMPTWVPFKHFNKLFKSVASWNLEKQLSTEAAAAASTAAGPALVPREHQLPIGSKHAEVPQVAHMAAESNRLAQNVSLPHLHLETVCNEATELVNGFSMKEVCSAMYQSPVHRNYGPTLGDIFPSAVEAVKRDTSPQRSLKQDPGSLAAAYIVSYVPGVGCTMVAFNGADGISVEALIIASTNVASTPKHDMFTCKFTNPQSILPVPRGAVADAVANKFLFPGSFAAMMPLLRCQFSTYLPVDREAPVDPNDPSQGYHGSSSM
jgi:hypothetical protein